MPNWCTNSIELGHKDPEVLKSMTEIMTKHGFCQAAVPLDEWSYHEACAKWGTKWDLTIDDEGDEDPWNTDTWESYDVTWVGTFANSAWGPPIETYQALVEQGFEVNAWWWEPGCEVVGQIKTIDGEACIDEWENLNDFLAVKDQDYVDSELRNYVEEDAAMWEQDEQEIN